MKLKLAARKSRRGIVILQDTRETRPIQFVRDEVIVGARRQKLDFGDYRAEFPDGTLSRFVFERKSIPDLWTTMTKGHNRFMAEVERARAQKARLVLIIEAPFSSVLIGFERSRYPGTAMAKKIWTLFHKYDLPFVFSHSRNDMANYIAWSFIAECLYRESAGRGRCR